MRFTFLLCIPALALLLSSPTLAQRNEELADKARWFQIELIVFTPAQRSAQTSELWRNDFNLSYPTQWLALRPPLLPQEPLEDGEINNDLDTPTADSLDIQTPTAITNDANTGANDWNATGDADNPFGTFDDPLAAETFSETPVQRELDERFILRLLPEEELELANEVKQLKRNQYRVLFHGAWRQGLFELPDSPGVIITGGELFDKHYELEGSITFSVSTYLRLDANLWLARFANNFGQEQNQWPNLPLRPDYSLTQPLQQQNNFSLGWNNFATFGSEYDAILAEPYVVEEVVRLKQTRYRMRSTELHYVDHPKVGLLVKILPYEPPEPEPETTADLATGDN